IRNAAQVLKLKGGRTVEQQWATNIIDRQVLVMSRLLEDLLDISRISRNQLEVRKTQVEMNRIIEAALETSRPFIEAGRHTLKIHLPPAPVYLVVDEVRLAQVLSNLLNNAAKYTEEGGRIDLTVEERDHWVIVSVKDNGIGIAADMLP